MMSDGPYPSDYGSDPNNERPFAPSDNYEELTMTQCPCCHSGELRSNKIENLPFDTTARGVLDAIKAGKNAHALTAGAVWGVITLANKFRADWVCGNCGAVF